MTDWVNQIKEQVIGRLEKDGLLDQKAKAGEKYAMVLAKKNILGRLVSKILNVPQDTESYSVIILTVPKQ